ncbi:hypothetical protein QSE00_23635 [Arenibacter sp. M-2]|uniref:hypothetical protein n=1 Tax=Arenibacter sp. M-2 TaxID=3053612 RepID=UPI00256FDFC4|nr:hypothetical protein [Arenibacter sp. M-2]MDL5514822.1 hypothetical protein [Arenibacter sp. M-2]
MKFLRYLLFLPICILFVGLIYYLFGLLSSWFFGLSTFWLIVVILFLGSMIWSLFSGLSILMMGFVSKISPNFKFAFWTIAVFSVLFGILAIISVWSLNINYSGKLLFAAIAYTVLVIQLTFALIAGSASLEE